MTGDPLSNIDYGIALVPQSVANGGTANGATISKPAQRGKFLSIFLLIGAQTSVTVFKASLYGRIGSGAFEVVKDAAGNDLTFTGTRFIAAGARVSNCTMGTIDVSRYKYDDYQFRVETVTSAASLVAANYVISETWDKPVAGVVEDWYEKSLPVGMA